MRKQFLLLLILFFSVSSFSQDKKDLSGVDGPYVLYKKEGVRIIRSNEAGAISDTLYSSLPPNFLLQVESQDGNHRFEVPLHAVKRQKCEYSQPDKVFVISDPHADLDCFVSILKAGKVMDKNYCWVFGSNHLVIIGDVFDRGNDVVPIYWLIYKLEQEATKAGGKLSFLIGNHEEMVLRNNLKYTKEKYTDLAGKLTIPYNQLWQDNSELGHWLKTRNTIETIGKNLFVHAGLSAKLLDAQWTVPGINDGVSQYLFESKEKRSEVPSAALLFGDSGPLWYRGMVKTDEKYNPITDEELLNLLKKFKVQRIFVGHTIFDDITNLHEGRVIAVNVDNSKNRKAGKGRGVLITKKELFVVDDAGNLQKME